MTVGLAEVNEAASLAKSWLEVVGAHDRWRILWVPETRFGVCPGSSRRVVGWQAGGIGVIDEVLLLGLLVLRSRRDRLPFGEAEAQARATDSGDV